MPHPDGSVQRKKQKVLVYLVGSLGDTIVSIPALRAVRRKFADAEIVVLQNYESGNIVLASHVIPDELVDRYMSYNSRAGRLGKVLGFLRLWRTIRRESFDAAAYLILSERPARAVHRDRLFFRSGGIRTLYGFHPFAKDELFPFEPDGHPAAAEHEAMFKLKRLERDEIAHLEESDLEFPLMKFRPEDLEEIDRWILERTGGQRGPLISIAPGCKTEVNAWPFENFVRLGQRLIETTRYEIIVTGGKAEFEVGEKLIAAWGKGINAAGQFSVRQSAALLSRCSIHIGLDTGTTHLAAAAGTRCFALYGEKNNPGTWYPLGDGHMLLYHRVPCAGCRATVHCPTLGHPCMTGISFESVWHHLRQFMDIGTAEPGSGVKAIAV